MLGHKRIEILYIRNLFINYIFRISFSHLKWFFSQSFSKFKLLFDFQGLVRAHKTCVHKSFDIILNYIQVWQMKQYQNSLSHNHLRTFIYGQVRWSTSLQYSLLKTFTQQFTSNILPDSDNFKIIKYLRATFTILQMCHFT